MDPLYKAILHDHYQNPRHRGELSVADFNSYQHNPSCGDSISFQGTVNEHNQLTNIAFNGTGCVISQATASLLSEHVLNKSIEYIQTLDTKHILDLIGIKLGPTRLRCALLSLEALQQGISLHSERKTP
jgi:nitrogen fixation NifU-like protein